MIKEQQAFILIEKVLDAHGDLVDGMHICDVSEDESIKQYRIYHRDGHCWDVSRDELTLNDIEEFGSPKGTVHHDGGCYYYLFLEEHDGFDKSGIDKCIFSFNKIL